MTEQVEISSFDLRYECCRMKSTIAEKILLQSILTHGIRDPLQGVDTKDGIRILLNGFKRVKCAQKLGIGIVPWHSFGNDESVGYSAGNTGRKFDLETNYRVAEFKFIDWKGGAESIRQNGIFKDFYELAEYETDKKKVLYVVDTIHPLKFFKCRALTSVLSKQPGDT